MIWSRDVDLSVNIIVNVIALRRARTTAIAVLLVKITICNFAVHDSVRL